MTVDAERLTARFLREHPAMVALVEDRVVTVVPNRATFPFVKVSQIAGSPRFSIPLYLDESYLQIDAYGGPKALARQIIDTARTVLAEDFIGNHAEGVVTCVTFGDLSYIPDDAYEPPQPRWLATASVYTHP